MPYPPREGESLKDHAERLDQIRSLQREHAKMESRLGREKQFNRKVEINAEARVLQNQIDELTAS
jgi:hypothetical protein